MLNQDASSLQSQFDSQINSLSINFLQNLNFLETLEKNNCKINAISPRELFEKYQTYGFIYPKKMEFIAPFLPLIEKNWEKALSVGEEILWIVTSEDSKTNSWATVSNWRSTFGDWVSQHLVSSGNPLLSRSMMLGSQAKVIFESAQKPYHSFQNWYQPKNKYANKVFGISLNQFISPSYAIITPYHYYYVDPDISFKTKRKINILKYTHDFRDGFIHLLTQSRSHAFLDTEELLSDPELKSLNKIYEKAGLFRFRRILLAFLESPDVPMGAMIINRGPFGLNFSLIENHSELILDANLSDMEATEITSYLINEAKKSYQESYPATFIPVATSEKGAKALDFFHQPFLRIYNKTLWKQAGFLGWYINAHSIFESIEKRYQRMESK